MALRSVGDQISHSRSGNHILLELLKAVCLPAVVFKLPVDGELCVGGGTRLATCISPSRVADTEIFNSVHLSSLI